MGDWKCRSAVVLLTIGIAGTSSAGEWFPGPDQHVARDQRATLLQDGRLLLTGSGNYEVYSPATGLFTLPSPMLYLRSRHTGDPTRLLTATGLWS